MFIKSNSLKRWLKFLSPILSIFVLTGTTKVLVGRDCGYSHRLYLTYFSVNSIYKLFSNCLKKKGIEICSELMINKEKQK